MPKTTAGIVTAIAALAFVAGCDGGDGAPEGGASAAERVIRAAWDGSDDARRDAVCAEDREMGRSVVLEELTADLDGITYAQQRAAWGRLLDRECAG